MKYLNKAMYERMQLSSRLRMAGQTYEINDEIKAHYLAEGRDHLSESISNYLETRPLMSRYLPETIITAIFDEYIYESKPRTAELSAFIDNWVQQYETDIHTAFHDRRETYHNVKNLLPANFTAIYEKHHFHDAGITAVTHSPDHSISLQLNGSGSIGLNGRAVMTFDGVVHSEIPDELHMADWLYDEVDVTEDGHLDFHILVSANLPHNDSLLQVHEVRIVAVDFKFIFIEGFGEEQT